MYDLPPIFSPDWILVVQYMHFFKRFSSCIGHCFFLVVFHVKRVAQVYLYHSVRLGHHSRWLGCPLRDILLCDLIGKCMVRLKPTLFFFPPVLKRKGKGWNLHQVISTVYFKCCVPESRIFFHSCWCLSPGQKVEISIFGTQASKNPDRCSKPSSVC